MCNHFNIITFLKDLFLLKYLPKLGNGTSYGLLFIFGVLTSFHCIGMCGGIAISQSVKKAESKTEQVSKNKFIVLPSFFYNIGRVISYTIVGGLVGSLGHLISFSGPWKGIVPIVGGIFMIVMAVNLLNIFPSLKRFNIRMPSFAAKKLFKGNDYGPIVVGLLTGLMPCGPLQIVEVYALSTRSFIEGVLSMFVFSIGTIPLLLSFGVINTIMSKKFLKVILKVSSVIVLLMGILMIERGLALSGVCIDMPKMVNKSPEGFSTVQGSYQSVRTEIASDSFPPIEVVKGIPVRWNIHVKKNNLNECNNSIQIPNFEITKNLAVGDNIVEFTPGKSGEFIYTCWMGMIKSKIKVVNSIEELEKDNPKQKKNNNTDNISNKNNSSNFISNSSNEIVSESSNTTIAPQISAAAKTLTPTTMVNITSALDTSSFGSEGGTSKVATPVPFVANTVTNAATPVLMATPAPSKKTADVSMLQSFTGYIEDEDCFVYYADTANKSNAGYDTKNCLNMSSCAANGYGIAVLQSDNTYKFYYFDGAFAPNADGSQLAARKLVSDTSKSDHITIKVTGVLNGNTKTSPNDGKSYPVITVTSLTEN